MKKEFIGLMMAVFLVAGAFGLHFGKIRYGSIYDNNLELHYNARNIGSENIENAKVTIWIPELGFYTRTSTFDIDRGDKHGQFLLMPTGELEEGTYLAKLTLSNDHARDSKWIWLTVE